MKPIPLRGEASPLQIVALGREMALESRYARLGYDADLADKHARHILGDPSYIGFGLFDGAQLVGMITGVCGPFLPFSPAIVARQQLLFIAPAHRAPWLAAKLVESFIREAKRRGALDIAMENGTGYEPDRVGKLFEICGLTRVGGLYALEV